MNGFKYYSFKELGIRIIWSFIAPLCFRLSFRHFYWWRNFLLRAFGARIGKRVKIYPSVKISFPWLLEVGDNTVISWDVRIYNLGKISIGSQTIISQNVHLCGGTHDYKSKDFKLIRSGLTVGENVWIASDAFIGPGVRVASNSIVAARAVVIKDVPHYSMVGGNPARLIRNLEPDNGNV